MKFLVSTLFCLFCLAGISSCSKQGTLTPDQKHLRQLNNEAAEALRAGRYGDGARLAEKAYERSREILGETHSRTLTSLHNLAFAVENQGRFDDAEILYTQALQLRREVLGETHRHTLTSLNNLAGLYLKQGRYDEAGRLGEQTSSFLEKKLGKTHPDRLSSLNNLALIYKSQGRYGEAEALYEQTLRLRREILGKTHPATLTSLNNLAVLYENQERYSEAEPILLEVLELLREALGEVHPNTIGSINNLANLYSKQHRYDEAIPYFEQALQLRREVLGNTHPNTLASLNDLGLLYAKQPRFGDAEPFLVEALQLSRKALGEIHPDTLTSLNNLAELYLRQGRYDVAAPLYDQTLRLAAQTFGDAHPSKLFIQLNYVRQLILVDKLPAAVAELRRMEPQLLGWAGAEFYSTKVGRAQSGMLRRQALFQDVVLTLGVSNDSVQALTLAGDVMLRWKQLHGTEKAYLGRLVRISKDPEIKSIGNELARLRSRLAHLAQNNAPKEDLSKVLKALDAKELELVRKSRIFKQHLEVSRASLADVQAVMPQGSALVEFRQYRPVNFATEEFDKPRWAAMAVRGFDEVMLVDVGSVEESKKLLSEMRQTENAAMAEEAAVALYVQLFGAFDQMLQKVETLHIAADGLLSLVPFERLRLTDGRYWGEAQELHFLQTGRDLLPAQIEAASGRGLLALGGIDFGATALPEADQDVASLEPNADRKKKAGRGMTNALDVTRAQLGRFADLPGTKEEVGLIEAAYRLYRPREPIHIWEGNRADEARLKSLDEGIVAPPRVLHLATHGFYLSESQTRLPRPLLYSGLALAGANLALMGDHVAGDDGILYSLEAQNLNLEGTELVVLSACDTGHGSLEYSEGVVGLVYALRVAPVANRRD